MIMMASDDRIPEETGRPLTSLVAVAPQHRIFHQGAVDPCPGVRLAVVVPW